MKAILVNDDRSLRWDDVPNPEIKSEEVLVEIHAAALNRADLMQREGDYPPPPGCPEWMGLEVAGVIIEMGDEAKAKSNWKIGDKVCALLGGGGYAEYVAVKYDMLMPVPKNCSMVEAAAIPEAFATAYLNLFIEGNIKAGDTLLLMDQIYDEKNNDEVWTENTALYEAIKSLDDRERNILVLRYFEGKTQTEISKEVGISQAQVSRLEKSALKQIKANIC